MCTSHIDFRKTNILNGILNKQNCQFRKNYQYKNNHYLRPYFPYKYRMNLNYYKFSTYNYTIHKLMIICPNNINHHKLNIFIKYHMFNRMHYNLIYNYFLSFHKSHILFYHNLNIIHYYLKTFLIHMISKYHLYRKFYSLDCILKYNFNHYLHK